MKENIIFTDGSSRGNPGPGGWGAIVVVKGEQNEVTELGGKEEKTTNNRMEMKAVIEALSFLDEKKLHHETFSLFTDSSYLINGITKWVHAWQKNNWKTKDGEGVLNKDLWEKMSNLIKDLKINFKKVEGHQGVVGNERCDEIATGFGMGENPALFKGSLPDYKLDIYAMEKSDVKKSVKKNNVKAYSYISKVEGKIYIDKNWADCEKRVKGKSGVRFKKSISLVDEKKIVIDFTK